MSKRKIFIYLSKYIFKLPLLNCKVVNFLGIIFGKLYFELMEKLLNVKQENIQKDYFPLKMQRM